MLFKRPVNKEKGTNFPHDQTLSMVDEKAGRRRNMALFPRTLDAFLHPRFSKGPNSLYRQSDATGYLKYLILVPLFVIGSMAFSAFVWIPLLEKRDLFLLLEKTFLDMLQDPLALTLFGLSFVSFFAWDIATEVWTFLMLKRGLLRVPHPKSLPNLVHAVVVCQYKEPLEVLTATIESLANNTLARHTIVCIASEARDASAKAKFETLRNQFGHRFLTFITTYHHLESGEIVGKSSNENFAVRELHKYTQQQGMDPFNVMVTVCDADSLFDTVFLEQLEGEFWRMPDGRRVLYDSPINTYRNLPECCLLTQVMEVSRCQYTVFSAQSFRPAQSNYSLTLGFANEINYWDPSNTSEDFHTTLKAMAMTGAGTNAVVRVWSLILNDSVAGFQDRWVQAKRHMWGIEEVAWVWSQFRVLRLNRWLGMLQLSMGQMLMQSSVVPAWIAVLFPPVIRVLSAMKPETWRIIIAYFVLMNTYAWMKAIVREVLMYRYILVNRKHMMPMQTWQWIRLFAAWPILEFAANIIFNTLATWQMLIHAISHTTLQYVTAPKTFSVATNLTSSFSSLSSNEDLNAPLVKSTKTVSIVMGAPDVAQHRNSGMSDFFSGYSSTASTEDNDSW